MGEFVGDAVGLEIGDVEVGAVDGPLLEVAAYDFGVVMVFGLVGGEGEDRNEEQTCEYGEIAQFLRTHFKAEAVKRGDYRPI
jgi:hypothetical protein